MLPMRAVYGHGSGLDELCFPVLARVGKNIVYAAIVDLETWFVGGCALLGFELFAVGLLVDSPCDGLRAVPCVEVYSC